MSIPASIIKVGKFEVSCFRVRVVDDMINVGLSCSYDGMIRSGRNSGSYVSEGDMTVFRRGQLVVLVGVLHVELRMEGVGERGGWGLRVWVSCGSRRRGCSLRIVRGVRSRMGNGMLRKWNGL